MWRICRRGCDQEINYSNMYLHELKRFCLSYFILFYWTLFNIISSWPSLNRFGIQGNMLICFVFAKVKVNEKVFTEAGQLFSPDPSQDQLKSCWLQLYIYGRVNLLNASNAYEVFPFAFITLDVQSVAFCEGLYTLFFGKRSTNESYHYFINRLT